MESYFQHTRYASRPQIQPQPQLQHQHQPHPRHSFSNNPNFYTPHHSSLHAPPPPLHRSQGPPPPQPPPPLLQSFQSVPTPPPFNPQNSQFTYNNNNNHNHPGNFNLNHRPRSDLHNFIQSPRVIHQQPFDDVRIADYNRDNRSDLKDPSRVLPDIWPGRQYIPANIDPDSYRRQSNNRPMSPMKIKHELEGNSMFIEEQEILLSRGDDNYHRRNQFGSTTSDRSSRDFRLVSAQMNHSSPYEDLRGGSSYDDGPSDNQRWVHDREVIRDSFIDMGSNEIGDLDEKRIVSGKREHYRGREVNAEFERHSGKGSREGSYEFIRTPRKPPQKKSVLLRIQKPNYRNREDDRVHYPGYFDDTKSSFRGKDQNLYPDRDVGEPVREGSPVELDVSFKSNSLVAKAIVTPASSFAGVSDSNLAPRNEKVRKVLVLNKDTSSSPLIKPNEGTAKLDNSSVANNASRFDKNLTQSKEKVTASVIGDVHNRSSLPGSSGAKVWHAKSKTGSSTKDAMSNKGETNVVSGKTSSVKVAKKKKIVKRVVKKVVNPNLSSSSSQPTKECGKPLIAASSEPEKDAAITSIDIVDSKHRSNETTVMPENYRVEGTVNTIASENGMSDDSGLLCVPNIKRKRNDSTSPSGSSSHEETKINENMVHGTTPNDLHSVSDTDKDCTKLLNETTSLDVDIVENAKQLCQNRHLSVPENNVENGSPKLLLSTECDANFCFSSPKKNKIHEFPASSCNTTLGCEPDNGLINSSERIKDFDCETTDVGSKQPSPTENGIVDQFLNPSFSVGSSKSCWQSNSGEMAIQNAAACASCSSEGVGTVVSSEGGPTVSGEINFSSHGTNDDIHKQPSPDMVTISLENGLEEGSPNYMVSRGGSKEDTSNIEKRKQKVETPQLDLSKSELDDLYLEPVNMVNSAYWVDTTLRLSFKDATPTEFTVSGDGHRNVGLQPCTDGVSAFPERSSMDVAGVSASVSNTTDGGSNGTSSKNTKKRKFTDSQLELTCLIASDVKEGPETASGVKAPSNSCNGLTQSEAEARVPAFDPLRASDSPSLQREITPSPHTGGRYENTALSLKNAIEDDGLRGAHSCLAAEELAVPKVQSLCLSGFEGEQVADAGSILQNNSIHIENDEMKKMDVDLEQASADNGTTQCEFPPELQSPDLDERLRNMDVEYDSCQYVQNDLPSVSNYLSSLRDGNGVSNTNSGDKVTRLVLDTLSDMDCVETLPDVPSTSYSQLSLEKGGGDDEMLHGKPAIQGGSITSAVTSCSLHTENTLSSDHGTENDHSFSGKTGPLPSQVSRNSTQMLKAIGGEISNGRKNQPTLAVSRIYPGRSSFGLTAKTAASSTHNSKSRTWHRTDNSSASALPGVKAFSSTVPTQRQLPRKITKLPSTSYIRKGNSLVRKPALVTSQSQGSHGLSSVNRLNSLGTDEVKKNAGSDSRTDVDPPNFMRTGVNASFERPRTPPLPSAAKMPNHATNSLGDFISSPSAEPLQNYPTETASDPMTCASSNDVLKSSEDVIKIAENPMMQTGQINIFDCNNETNNGDVVSSNASSLTYVKRKSNQLVATSNPCSFPVNNAHNSMSIPSDGYYKRRKNQLIRTSLESQVKPTVSVLDESVDSEGKTLHGISSSRSLSKRLLRKVISKTGKRSKFSLVWTLRSSQLSKDSGDSLHHKKVLPHLFPWKRATYWRSFMPISAANSSNSSSTIRKLLLLRKRDTVYTRSKHGFSLRKSKVLSVGGSSLKWSKSIEKQSKKANEEATLAVAEAERKKREQSGAPHVTSGTKDKNSCRKSVHSIKLHPGERIFRIGTVRYKMDSSRRTLQRMSDDESSNSAALQTEKEAERSYVPRRLVIGKDEYVRIGNGNQLIRDPKKRTRILASEKVRWSLHTARSRLARKRKYCQFFTRFGKCNKDDGKCPYIHDSSKIAVCTKFLNGLCLNLDCKLTHKVIPERMPDCSYFLQGLCTNKNCPYRHVHVNPNAPTCEGFLRGYCADGNECRMKHSYVCPTYEATGSCPKGSKCKLHHPKKRSKGKKSKQSRERKKALGRYFGSMNINVSEPGIAESEKHSVQENDNICFEGRITDYISLDVSGEAGENINPVDEQTSLSGGDPSELPLVDLDELIKPIGIMNI